jgi:hypothetical protein
VSSELKNSFQKKIYAKVNSGSLYTGLFSFMLLSFLLLLFPGDVFSGQVTLTWNAPTTNADGTPITYFSGDYRIYYGTASGNYSQVTNLNNSNSLVTQQVSNLTSGQLYFFVVSAINTLGNESSYSNEISKTAQSVTPTTFTITASAGAKGTITPSGTTLVNTGASQAYSITPSTGYHVRNVFVDGVSVGAVTTYTFSGVTAKHTISAYFGYGVAERHVCLDGCQYSTIQQAVSESRGGDTIKVAEGVYNENIVIDAVKTLVIQGGWDSGFTSMRADPSVTEINGDITGDGSGDGSVMAINTGPAANIFVSIENMTLTNGDADNGGGVRVSSSANMVTLVLKNTVLSGNTAGSGGGLSAVSSNSGHISVSLVNDVIAENAAANGGAVYAYSQDAGSTTEITVTNGTVTSNAASNGGGLYIGSADSGKTTVTAGNTVIWGNTAIVSGDDIFLDRDKSVTVLKTSYSDIGEVEVNTVSYAAGPGDIDSDPVFVNPAAGDYNLHLDSPCRDSGSSAGVPDHDLFGVSRPQGAGYDMGAEEHVEAVSPHVQLLSPRGHEIIPAGKPYNITWNAPSNAVNFKVRYSPDNGSTWQTLSSGITALHYTWQVPALIQKTETCVVRVVGFDSTGTSVGSDRSDTPFTILKQ